MNILDQLRERVKKKKKEKEREESELKKIRKEVFRVIKAVYIEPLVSRPPPIFGESSESFREERDIEKEILEVL
jgi:hypothetical protein